MRIALVYDCLYPYSGGGAERWLRALAEELANEHDITYVTRRVWGDEPVPSLGRARCVGVSPAGPIYTPSGRRRLLPAIRFALGTLVHFARRRREYDVVHCLSYPYLPLIAIRLALAGGGGGRKVWCEWLECLSPDYWRHYGGRLGGVLGRALQRLCVACTPQAFAFSEHTCRRLRETGFSGPLVLLGGLAEEPSAPPTEEELSKREELVLFAGRHVPDKGVLLLPETIQAVRSRRPGLRAVITGEGPQHAELAREIDRLGLADVIRLPGFVPAEELRQLYRSAACLLAPSIRDGYGMAVAEAAAAGLPVVVCRAPDNAATERLEPGVNGEVADAPLASELAAAVLRVLDQDAELRRRTAAWYSENADQLSMGRSIERVKEIYAGSRPLS
jgi:glycosyltransferase involved in cell wall biosynthesis